MIPLVMTMRHILRQRMAERRFPKEDHPRETLLFDGSAIPHHAHVIEEFLSADTIPLQRRRLCDTRTALPSRHSHHRTARRSEIPGVWSRGCAKNSAGLQSLIEPPSQTQQGGW